MVVIGKELNKEVVCVLTNMDQPVGNAIGNQLEIIEAVKALKGDMPEDVKEIVYGLGEQMLIMDGKASNSKQAHNMISEAISSGKALEKFRELVQRQGGDVSYIDDLSKFENAKFVVPVVASKAGLVYKIETEKIGKISVVIGAGRLKKDDKIDFQAGIVMNKKINDKVCEGDVLAYVYTNMEDKVEDAVREVAEAFVIRKARRIKRKNVIRVIK